MLLVSIKYRINMYKRFEWIFYVARCRTPSQKMHPLLAVESGDTRQLVR